MSNEGPFELKLEPDEMEQVDHIQPREIKANIDAYNANPDDDNCKQALISLIESNLKYLNDYSHLKEKSRINCKHISDNLGDIKAIFQTLIDKKRSSPDYSTHLLFARLLEFEVVMSQLGANPEAQVTHERYDPQLDMARQIVKTKIYQQNGYSPAVEDWVQSSFNHWYHVENEISNECTTLILYMGNESVPMDSSRFNEQFQKLNKIINYCIQQYNNGDPDIKKMAESNLAYFSESMNDMELINIIKQNVPDYMTYEQAGQLCHLITKVEAFKELKDLEAGNDEQLTQELNDYNASQHENDRGPSRFVATGYGSSATQGEAVEARSYGGASRGAPNDEMAVVFNQAADEIMGAVAHAAEQTLSPEARERLKRAEEEELEITYGQVDQWFASNSENTIDRMVKLRDFFQEINTSNSNIRTWLEQPGHESEQQKIGDASQALQDLLINSPEFHGWFDENFEPIHTRKPEERIDEQGNPIPMSELPTRGTTMLELFMQANEELIKGNSAPMETLLEKQPSIKRFFDKNLNAFEAVNQAYQIQLAENNRSGFESLPEDQRQAAERELQGQLNSLGLEGGQEPIQTTYQGQSTGQHGQTSTHYQTPSSTVEAMGESLPGSYRGYGAPHNSDAEGGGVPSSQYEDVGALQHRRRPDDGLGRAEQYGSSFLMQGAHDGHSATKDESIQITINIAADKFNAIIKRAKSRAMHPISSGITAQGDEPHQEPNIEFTNLAVKELYETERYFIKNMEFIFQHREELKPIHSDFEAGFDAYFNSLVGVLQAHKKFLAMLEAHPDNPEKWNDAFIELCLADHASILMYQQNVAHKFTSESGQWFEEVVDGPGARLNFSARVAAQFQRAAKYPLLAKEMEKLHREINAQDAGEPPNIQSYVKFKEVSKEQIRVLNEKRKDSNQVIKQEIMAMARNDDPGIFCFTPDQILARNDLDLLFKAQAIIELCNHDKVNAPLVEKKKMIDMVLEQITNYQNGSKYDKAKIEGSQFLEAVNFLADHHAKTKSEAPGLLQNIFQRKKYKEKREFHSALRKVARKARKKDLKAKLENHKVPDDKENADPNALTTPTQSPGRSDQVYGQLTLHDKDDGDYAQGDLSPPSESAQQRQVAQNYGSVDLPLGPGDRASVASPPSRQIFASNPNPEYSFLPKSPKSPGSEVAFSVESGGSPSARVEGTTRLTGLPSDDELRGQDNPIPGRNYDLAPSSDSETSSIYHAPETDKAGVPEASPSRGSNEYQLISEHIADRQDPTHGVVTKEQMRAQLARKSSESQSPRGRGAAVTPMKQVAQEAANKAGERLNARPVVANVSDGVALDSIEKLYDKLNTEEVKERCMVKDMALKGDKGAQYIEAELHQGQKVFVDHKEDKHQFSVQKTSDESKMAQAYESVVRLAVASIEPGQNIRMSIPLDHRHHDTLRELIENAIDEKFKQEAYKDVPEEQKPRCLDKERPRTGPAPAAGG